MKKNYEAVAVGFLVGLVQRDHSGLGRIGAEMSVQKKRLPESRKPFQCSKRRN